ncbi:uncharacterized protein [Drosophila takahashii]|uniref:uncharacterized protein n=1 Tax=Drosophila takahashii TaxID=29030 RepID=UPI001CF7FCC3|nr:uncharacterized protein LOC108058608 [Drosophila takahashii]
MLVQGIIHCPMVALLLLLSTVSGSPARGHHHHRDCRSYKDIARIVNPNQYAFPGSRIYPDQPFWPFGKE